MEIGKLTNEKLNEIILSNIKNKRSETITGPAVGRDCAELDYGGDIIVISSDPITGTTENIGRLCVNVCTNDVAASGAEPVSLMVTMLIPPKATEHEVAKISSELISACEEINVDLIGGHTEVSDAVNRFVLSGVCLGRKKRKNIRMPKAGDKIVMSKTAAIEGTGIVVSEQKDYFTAQLGSEWVEKAVKYIENTSVIREGRIGSDCGVFMMHDATEGGIFGACWELADSCDLGVTLYADDIPISDITQYVCKVMNISPYRLISSGVMLFVTDDDEKLISSLNASGIQAATIGTLTNEARIFTLEGNVYELEAPKSDELYKALSSLL